MFEFKEMSASDGETEGRRQTEMEVELSKGEQQKLRREKKEPWMDALLIALNHGAPLCLRRCVDTTSANTQGRC